jgi:hypothetical protein
MMALPDDATPEAAAVAYTRQWAIIRLVFGTLQTVGSTAGFVLLVRSGINKLSVSVIGATAGVTILSRLVFRRTDKEAARE